MIIEHQLLDAWMGAEPNWEAGSGSDYDRACAIPEWIGVISVGSGQGLVLGADPTPTRILEAPHALVLLRWIHAPDGWQPPDVRDLLQQSWAGALAWVVGDSRQVIQDSAYPGGHKSAARLGLSLPAGLYRVDTAEYRPDPEVWMILHRIVDEGGDPVDASIGAGTSQLPTPEPTSSTTPSASTTPGCSVGSTPSPEGTVS